MDFEASERARRTPERPAPMIAMLRLSGWFDGEGSDPVEEATSAWALVPAAEEIFGSRYMAISLVFLLLPFRNNNLYQVEILYSRFWFYWNHPLHCMKMAKVAISSIRWRDSYQESR